MVVFLLALIAIILLAVFFPVVLVGLAVIAGIFLVGVFVLRAIGDYLYECGTRRRAHSGVQAIPSEPKAGVHRTWIFPCLTLISVFVSIVVVDLISLEEGVSFSSVMNRAPMAIFGPLALFCVSCIWMEFQKK